MLNDPIDVRLAKLPLQEQKEVIHFIEFLEKKNKSSKSKNKLKLDWVGGLSEFKDKYTALELQKKGLEWWGDTCI